MTIGSRNERLNAWVREVADLCKPDDIAWCDGSKAEYDRMMALLQERGMAIPLRKRPNSHLFRTETPIHRSLGQHLNFQIRQLRGIIERGL